VGPFRYCIIIAKDCFSCLKTNHFLCVVFCNCNYSMHIETLTRDSTFDFSKIEIFSFTVKVKLAYFFFQSFFFHFINSSTIDFLFLMIFIQEYTMFWFGFDDYARRHLFVWNIILKHDVVINYQRIPYKLENCVHFFYYQK